MNLTKRNYSAFSLIETMTVIAVIAIVLGLLFAYQERGWKLFYQSYTRGLSQIKAKVATRILSDDLREANKTRLTIDKGISYGVPQPDDIQENSSYIYFTKPKNHPLSGDAVGYDYVLYYFAKPKEKKDTEVTLIRKRVPDKEKFLILKSIRFINQSKHYTEDERKSWPFLPPILEIHKSTLPEDEAFIRALNETGTTSSGGNSEEETQTKKQGLEQELFLDYFSYLKKETRNIPLAGNFAANSLTDPFSKEEVKIFFGEEYKNEKPIKIKVSIREPGVLFGLNSPTTEFEVKVTPRN